MESLKEGQSLQVYYQTLLEKYRHALEDNVQLTASEFCRQEGIDIARVTHWAQRHNMGLSQIKRDVLFSKGLIDSPHVHKPPREVYAEAWADFKKSLEEFPELTLSSYCTLHNISQVGIEKWMARRNYSVAELKNGLVCIENRFFNKEAKKRLGGMLKQFKAALARDPDYSLRTFCQQRHIEYQMMYRYMNSLGITYTQLKQAAILEDKCPRKRRNVFVQFKPNGGTSGDKLTGVKIQMPDGSTIMVEECTVISLCSFINQYNNDQKRRS